ncbi:hypothetical protein BSLA_03f1623 [Burkholderia stabilis]|nr:hypothetical protein BSLA_03f1623 [Burkholderia stabilis]
MRGSLKPGTRPSHSAVRARSRVLPGPAASRIGAPAIMKRTGDSQILPVRIGVERETSCLRRQPYRRHAYSFSMGAALSCGLTRNRAEPRDCRIPDMTVRSMPFPEDDVCPGSAGRLRKTTSTNQSTGIGTRVLEHENASCTTRSCKPPRFPSSTGIAAGISIPSIRRLSRFPAARRGTAAHPAWRVRMTGILPWICGCPPSSAGPATAPIPNNCSPRVLPRASMAR